MAAATCIGEADLYMAIAVANIVSDVVIFIIPIRTVVGLKMPRGTKGRRRRRIRRCFDVSCSYSPPHSD